MKKKIFLYRHGRTAFNAQGIVQGSGVDASLDDVGREQAQDFYKVYKEHSFDILVTSRLKRAIETAHPFESSIPVVIRDHRINEIHWGVSEGKKSTKDEIAAYKTMIKEWGQGNLTASLEGGESAASLIQRCDNFITTIHKRQRESWLICSHGRTIRCLLTRFLQLPVSEMENMTHKNTGLFELSLEKGKFKLLRANDVSHLEES